MLRYTWRPARLLLERIRHLDRQSASEGHFGPASPALGLHVRTGGDKWKGGEMYALAVHVPAGDFQKVVRRGLYGRWRDYVKVMSVINGGRTAPYNLSFVASDDAATLEKVQERRSSLFYWRSASGSVGCSWST
eukprot:NODE_1902_length_1362_cov_50.684692_g1722_i0.p1 GENE.NODE_1902_length_1362_cov_50.684692_g1722_i0~~NODE_1902_length_1362_cov_50.684692_g1722_i0.p1  ORF type:complete len:134 (+),score=15.36 NODE_1902_length_1362_cov_50.684692_g1722_i0:463-864(+)